MPNKTLFLFAVILLSYINCTDYKIKELQLNKLYDEKTKGTKMNIYSADLVSSIKPESDLVVDAQLKDRVGIFDTPIVFVSTVSNFLMFRSLYQTL